MAAGEKDPALTRLDPRDLIGEAYRMEGLAPEACRSIFFDWALGRSAEEGTQTAARALHARYAAKHPEHPMTAVLAEAFSTVERPARPVRRGGRRARRGEAG